MDLSLTAEQEMLKTAVRGFIQQEYPKSVLLEMAESGDAVPSEPWQKLVETGWMGILAPPAYGMEFHQRSAIVAIHPGGAADIQKVIMARRIGIGREVRERAGALA